MASEKRKTYKGNDQKVWRALFTFLKETYGWPELTRLNDRFGRARLEQVALHNGWFIQWPLPESEVCLAKGDYNFSDWLYEWPYLPPEPKLGKYSYYLILQERYPECGDDLKKAHDLDDGRIVLGRKRKGQQSATPASGPALALAPPQQEQQEQQQEQQQQQQAPRAAPLPPIQEPASGHLPDSALSLGQAVDRFWAENSSMATAMEESMSGDHLQSMQPEGGAPQATDGSAQTMGEGMPGDQMDFAWEESAYFSQAELFGLPMDSQGELLFLPPAQQQADFYEPSPADSAVVGYAPGPGPAPGMPLEFQGEPSFSSEQWTSQDVYDMMVVAEKSLGPPAPRGQ